MIINSRSAILLVSSLCSLIAFAQKDSYFPANDAEAKSKGLTDQWSTFPLYKKADYREPLRPQFHFTSRMGWLNDPNGMVYYDGEWHMCFQHYAKGNASGHKSWGNAISTDLIHWKQLPHAINPYPNINGTDGIHAIWSGSAVVDELNALGKQKGDTKTLFALYSATNKEFFQGGAFSTDKGRTWTKIDAGKPVIPYQQGRDKGQRDPRIFYMPSKKYYVTIMMVGGKNRAVRLWKSTDLLNWEILGDIPNKAAECIDMYTVAVDGDKSNMKWVIADAGTHYEIGDFDGEKWTGSGHKKPKDRPLKFDYGDSYYAAQVFNDGPNGRIIHIGWLRSKSLGFRPFLEANMPFTQQMSIPAEITLQTTPDGIRMRRNPVKEIKTLYTKSHTFKKLNTQELTKKLVPVTPELVDLTISFEPKDDLTLHVRGLKIHYKHAAKVFQFTNSARVNGEKAAIDKLPANHRLRKHPYRDNGLRSLPAPSVNGQVKLRILVDRASLELFANEGQAAASFVVVPDSKNKTISVTSKNNATINRFEVNELKSIWK